MSKIENLPVDANKISEQEKEIVDLLFEQNINPSHPILLKNQEMIQQSTSFISKMFIELKDGLWIVLLFLIFTLPFTDQFIQKYIPFQSSVIIYSIKIVFILILYWFIKNSNLLFKNG
jgi:hypothetical protein